MKKAGPSGANGDAAGGWNTTWGPGREVSGGPGRGERSRAAAEREEPRSWEARGRGRAAGRQGLRRPRLAPRRARTHVLPPAGSARLSSCRRLAGAGLGPQAWSGLLSPRAPSPPRRSPRAAGAACQPPPAAPPEPRPPGPAAPPPQQLPHSRAGKAPAPPPPAPPRRRGGRGAARDKRFRNANALGPAPAPQLCRAPQRIARESHPPSSGNTGQDKLWTRNLSGRVASLDPISFTKQRREKFLAQGQIARTWQCDSGREYSHQNDYKLQVSSDVVYQAFSSIPPAYWPRPSESA